NYRDELLDQASVEYEKIRRSFNSLHRKLELSDIEVKDFLVSEVEEIKHRFIEAMSNDFNTANAITEIINISKFANTILREKELDYDKLYATYKLFKEILWVLGIETQIEDLSEEDRKLVKEYEEARKARNFAVSDELRKIITEKGIIL
ncbi:MAG TPA: cysteine--tRNA ligase, partial [Acholeplasmataceae bacterium]|nr:cysteine--tRNA ligase [Acholeplasmataceae bacterium]